MLTFCRNFDLALERTLGGNCPCLNNDNETHFHIRAYIAHEGLKTRRTLQIIVRIVLSIPAIFTNVKKICKKYQKFNNCPVKGCM